MLHLCVRYSRFINPNVSSTGYVALPSPLTSESRRIMKSLVFRLWAGWPGRRQALLGQRGFVYGFAGAA